MRRFFAVKGLHDVEKVVEIGGKAHMVTGQGTFKVKDNMHSNTFLVGSTPILKIYDLCPIDHREVYNSFEPCSIRDIEHTGSVLKNIDSMLSRSEIEVLKKTFYLVEKNGCLARLEYSEMIKVLQYIQSLENIDEFSLYGSAMREWAISNFGGGSSRDISLELGFFILLKWTNSGTDLTRLDGFVYEWKRHDLTEPNLKQLLEYLDNTFIRKEEKSRIKSFLGRLA